MYITLGLQVLAGQTSGPSLSLRSVVLHAFPPLAATPHLTIGGHNVDFFISAESDVEVLPGEDIFTYIYICIYLRVYIICMFTHIYYNIYTYIYIYIYRAQRGLLYQCRIRCRSASR